MDVGPHILRKRNANFNAIATRTSAMTSRDQMRSNASALLTPQQMDRADRAALSSAISGFSLMQAAGAAVAVAIGARWPIGPVTVLCGPGNNGSTGFVSASHLKSAGRAIKLALLGSRDTLSGEAAEAALQWSNPIEPFTPKCLEGASIAIDAIFGAGLSRPLTGPALTQVEALKLSDIPVCAIDVPSGVDGSTGPYLAGRHRRT